MGAGRGAVPAFPHHLAQGLDGPPVGRHGLDGPLVGVLGFVEAAQAAENLARVEQGQPTARIDAESLLQMFQGAFGAHLGVAEESAVGELTAILDVLRVEFGGVGKLVDRIAMTTEGLEVLTLGVLHVGIQEGRVDAEGAGAQEARVRPGC
jgi:hypothetical protein